MSAPVELINASKHYGAVEALRGVDISIDRGEVVAMLGPNGAGKTTAISLMLGLRKPTGGQARLFGMEPTDRRARSQVGVMLQESGVPVSLKVKELIDLFRSYYPSPLTRQRAIGMAGLEDKADSPVGKLSGGQKQRLYFALAICGDPEVVFFDEPTVGMDVEARRAFLDSTREFAEAGKTILLTTHYLAEADELARRIILIDKGLVIADATPREIKAKVVGKRVAFNSDPALSESDLAGLPAQNIQISGARVSLLSNEPEALLKELFGRGRQIRDLEVSGADLEEAFLTLTSHEKEAIPT